MKTLVVTVFGVLLGGTVLAFDITGNVGLTTDFVWRGVSQNAHSPAVQGGLDCKQHVSLVDVFVGDWVSNTGAPALMENDLYFGLSKELFSGFNAKLQYTWYAYLKKSVLNTSEFTAGVSYAPLSFLNIDANFNYILDYFGTETASTYVSFGPSVSLPLDVSLSPTIGYTIFEDKNKAGCKDYVDYKLSIIKSHADGWKFALSYTNTNRDTYNADAGSFESASDSSIALAVTKTY